jgi:hypothetical protein
MRRAISAGSTVWYGVLQDLEKAILIPAVYLRRVHKDTQKGNATLRLREPTQGHTVGELYSGRT